MDLKNIDFSQYKTESESFSYVNQLINMMIKDTQIKFFQNLKDYLKKNLASIGYYFETEETFLDFLQCRITSVEINIGEYELYLDYKNEEETGTLIGVYSEEINVEIKDYHLNVTIG